MNGEEEGQEYGLIMPFLPVVSKGGPFDDQAYTAGWEKHSCAVEIRESGVDGWIHARFTSSPERAS